MEYKVKFTWKCPKCGKKHKWKWEFLDLPRVGDEIHMVCDKCEVSTKMECVLVDKSGTEIP